MSENPTPEQNYQKLQDAALISLGFLLAKEGPKAAPVVLLAKTLKDTGCKCDHVDAILQAAAS